MRHSWCMYFVYSCVTINVQAICRSLFANHEWRSEHTVNASLIELHVPKTLENVQKCLFLAKSLTCYQDVRITISMVVCFVCNLTDRTFYFDAGAFNYLDVGIDLTYRNWVVLQAKACSDVYISLTSQPNMFSGTGYYELTFDWLLDGIYYNSIAWIYTQFYYSRGRQYCITM